MTAGDAYTITGSGVLGDSGNPYRSVVTPPTVRERSSRRALPTPTSSPPRATPDELASLTARRDAMAMPPQAVAQTIAFAIAQPDSVDVGEVIVRPTVQP